MGFRFRRRLRIVPGVWLNVAKTGISASIGRAGATLNLSPKGAQTTVGLPGSGISYRSRLRPWGRGPGRQPLPSDPDRGSSSPTGGGPAFVAVIILIAVAAVLALAFLR